MDPDYGLTNMYWQTDLNCMSMYVCADSFNRSSMSASMAQSLKCKACVELQRMELQRMELQRLAADTTAESDVQVFRCYPDVQVRSTLPPSADTIPKELLDQIPEEYFDVQHHWCCSCIGCNLIDKLEEEEGKSEW